MHARAGLPRWNGPRTRFQIVSDVAEGLPDGSHDSSYTVFMHRYIYAGWGFFAGFSSMLTRRLSSQAAPQRVTWPAGGTCAQLVASPVETADNQEKK